MVEDLGGPTVPAIGFAMGLERILLAMGDQPATTEPLCMVLPLGASALGGALTLARALRRAGVRTELDGRGNSLKSMLRRADSLGARACLVLGEAELERGVVQLKDLAAHRQDEISLERAVDVVADRLALGGVRRDSEEPA